MNLEDVILRDTRANQPAATDVASGTLYYVTDESVTERSNGAAWQDYSDSGGGAGIDQLTGDVTAGPGSGSQAATIANNAVTTAKIIDAAVTYAKIQDVSAASKILGRGAAGGAGDVEEITVGSGLAMAGTTLSADGGILDVVSQLDINNTAAETSIYSFSVPANTIPAIGYLRASIIGDILNSTGGSRTIQIKVKYGATTLYDGVTTGLGTTAARHPFVIEVTLGNLGVTNSQFASLVVNIGNANAPTTGIGSIGAGATVVSTSGGGSAAEDSTTTLTLDITVTCSGVASANFSVRRQYASLELMS